MFTTVFISIPILSAVIYLLVSFGLSKGLNNRGDSTPNCENVPSISLLIAAKDEEVHLPHLLNSLLHQTLNNDQFEIIVINDRSSDNTENIIKEFQKKLPNLSYITITKIPEGIAPKKNAISKGVELSKNEIIVITDADCVVQPQWLEIIAKSFCDKRVGLVQGATFYRNIDKSLLMRYQNIDFFSHTIVAASGIGVNLPINSNANNFAYRREVFNSIDGYSSVKNIVSGDDDLLLQKVWENGKWKINYIFDNDSVVYTEPSHSWKSMINQRKRWGSKTVHYKTNQVIVLSSIFLFYVLTLISFFFTLFCIISPLYTLSLLTIKIIGELFFLLPGSKLFNKNEIIVDIWWASIVQLIVVVTAVLGGVFGTFTWKNQTTKRKL